MNIIEVDNDDDVTMYSNASAHSEKMKEIFGKDIPEEPLSLADPRELNESSKQNASKRL
jgi:hypothetical protein